MTPPGRSRRRLNGIEAALATDTRLASMFAMFNALNHGEPAWGPDPLPPSARLCSGWLAPGQRASRVAALVAMMAIIVGGVLLSVAVRPVVRSCVISTPAGAPGTAAVSGSGARAGPALRAFSPGLVPLCRAYPANK
ncbi:MAG TPA: hypothetical protein VH589_16945 [Trebonia sp.]|jgi:hypothetical protein